LHRGLEMAKMIGKIVSSSLDDDREKKVFEEMVRMVQGSDVFVGSGFSETYAEQLKAYTYGTANSSTSTSQGKYVYIGLYVHVAHWPVIEISGAEPYLVCTNRFCGMVDKPVYDPSTNEYFRNEYRVVHYNGFGQSLEGLCKECANPLTKIKRTSYTSKLALSKMVYPHLPENMFRSLESESSKIMYVIPVLEPENVAKLGGTVIKDQVNLMKVVIDAFSRSVGVYPEWNVLCACLERAGAKFQVMRGLLII